MVNLILSITLTKVEKVVVVAAAAEEGAEEVAEKMSLRVKVDVVDKSQIHNLKKSQKNKTFLIVMKIS
jgi:hypothetical protein